MSHHIKFLWIKQETSFHPNNGIANLLYHSPETLKKSLLRCQSNLMLHGVAWSENGDRNIASDVMCGCV